MRQNWQLWEGALSPAQCDEIIATLKKECTMEQANVFGGSPEDVRKTSIGWTANPEIQSMINGYVLGANQVFNLDIDHMVETQFGEYTTGGHYSWHHDVDFENESGADRKISTVVQLSDPSDYVGGDFEFSRIETPQGFRTRGSVLCFVSYNTHRVTPLESGTRYSLVNWMEGPTWR